MKRVLLDGCLDRRFGDYLEGFETRHVLDLGWEKMADVRLVEFAADEFDVLVTVDRGMAGQVSPGRLRIAVVVLRARSNRLKDCLPRLPELLDTIPTAEKGRFTII